MGTATEQIKVDQFGKDHWNLLGYIETRCVDGRSGIGTLDFAKLRINHETHPLLAQGPRRVKKWSPKYGTRLKGFDDESTPELLLVGHDDWDCVDEMQREGMLEIHSAVNGYVELLGPGLVISAALRTHKATGGSFGTFDWRKGTADRKASVDCECQNGHACGFSQEVPIEQIMKRGNNVGVLKACGKTIPGWWKPVHMFPDFTIYDDH